MGRYFKQIFLSLILILFLSIDVDAAEWSNVSLTNSHGFLRYQLITSSTNNYQDFNNIGTTYYFNGSNNKYAMFSLFWSGSVNWTQNGYYRSILNYEIGGLTDDDWFYSVNISDSMVFATNVSCKYTKSDVIVNGIPANGIHSIKQECYFYYNSSSGTKSQNIGFNFNPMIQLSTDTFFKLVDFSLEYGGVVSDDQQVIINQNDTIINNTQDIIDNQHSNTQDIIDNQDKNNEELKETIEDQFVDCSFKSIQPTIDESTTGYLSLQDTYVNSNYYKVSNYISINSNTNYTISVKTNYASLNAAAYCLYDSNRVKISCSTYKGNSSISFNSGDAVYFRTSIRIDEKYFTKILLEGTICSNRFDDTNDKLEGINGSLTDDTPPNTDNFISNLQGLVNDSPIATLILMPFTLLNRYVEGFSGNCSSINLGNLYGTDLTFSCINISSIVGSNLWSIIDGLVSIFMIYNIAMLFVSVFNDITSLRDTFDSLYTPQHAKTLGKHTSEVS